MPDREKIIKGLKCHQIDKDHRINCSDCPYHCDEFMNGLNELHNDALALLKEQQEQIDNLIEESASNAEMAEGLKELLKEQEDLGTELTNAVELIHKKNERIEKLLKEQEAKPMIENEHGWNCPSCGMKLIGKTASGYPCDLIDLPEDEPIHFCPKCGQAVKWDEID